MGSCSGVQREKRRREEVERKRASKMSELYMEDTLGEEQPSPCNEKFRLWSGVNQPESPVTGRD